ncbi:patatin-like phospholipase family protein [Pseudofulvibacter geojedonensis]|uniref:Patatin family protein n=1 Tax=Pseudofulvibacter geojedonensis TaxID=1123758 RepID=A0ABW3I2M5_9FLAO
MKALVISGGGSKGAFAGGVAEYLITELKRDYDLYLGSSTGSLLIPHLSIQKIKKIQGVYTNVNQHSIFSIAPFLIRHRKGEEFVRIHHFNVLRQLIKGKRTFGESKRLKKLIQNSISETDFNEIRATHKDIIITVTNLTLNRVEYKSIRDFTYEEYIEWIWISCNYVPFMSLVKKDEHEYADGGFSCIVPLQEAIARGATEIDAIILETEAFSYRKVIGKNPFSMMIDLFDSLLDQVEKKDIALGKLAAKHNNVKLNIYYTPTKLTDNSLVFNKKQMTLWWELGYMHAKKKNGTSLK